MVERLEAECEGTLCEVGGPVKETTDNKHRNGLEAFSAKSPRHEGVRGPWNLPRSFSERAKRVCDSKGTASVVFAGGRPARSPPLLAQRSLRRGARCLVTPDFLIPLAHQR